MIRCDECEVCQDATSGRLLFLDAQSHCYLCCDLVPQTWQHAECMLVENPNASSSYMCELCEPREFDEVRCNVREYHGRSISSHSLI